MMKWIENQKGRKKNMVQVQEISDKRKPYFNAKLQDYRI